VIRVGGATEIEVKERKDRVDDALHATRAAVEEGIVPGGGVALLRAKKAVEKLKSDNDDQAGINIVLKALEAPIRQIAENAGVEGSIVVGKIWRTKSETFGFDAQTEEYVDMIEAGIIDPTKVVRTALQDAASVAGLLVTTEAMVAELPKKEAADADAGRRRRHGRHGFGDAFIVGDNGAVHMLERVGCSAEQIATSEEEFWREVRDDPHGWQLRPLADECRRAGKVLADGQCYAFTTPPVLGGDYTVENVWVAPWREWFSLTADLFQQIKGIPDGATVSFKVVD
jgi:hypothetical protein